MKEFLDLNMFSRYRRIWIDKRKKVAVSSNLLNVWTVRKNNKVVFKGKKNKAITYLLSSGICIFI